MTDNEMSQQERDAAVIAKYRERMYTDKDGVMMFEFDPPEAHEPLEVDESDAAMLRTIDRLRADNEALRTACAGLPLLLTQLCGIAHANEYYETAEKARLASFRIRTTLGEPSPLTALAPAGDGADGDGERGSVQS